MVCLRGSLEGRKVGKGNAVGCSNVLLIATRYLVETACYQRWVYSTPQQLPAHLCNCRVPRKVLGTVENICTGCGVVRAAPKPFPGPSGNKGAVLGNAQYAWWRGFPGPGGRGRPLVSMESTHRSVPTACSGPSLRYEQEGTCLSAFQHKVLMGACQWHQMCALPVPKSHPAEAETVKAPTHGPS